MRPLMTPATGRRAARTVGLGTLAIGTALLLAPEAAGPVLALNDPRGARAVGLLDLALAPGLLAGEPRWPWLAARAMANLAIAAYALQAAEGHNRVRRARGVALALAAATVGDSTAAVATHGSPRRS